MPAGPQVHQSVARTAVEAQEGVANLAAEQRGIRDPANIDDGNVPVLIAEQLFVKPGNKWRTLATGGDIFRAKIGDRHDAGSACDRARVAQLQRESRRRVHRMDHGLAMAADGRDGFGRRIRIPEQCQCGVGEGKADFRMQ